MQVLSRFLQQIPFGMMRGSKFTGLGQMCAFQNMGFCRGELLIRLCFMRPDHIPARLIPFRIGIGTETGPGRENFAEVFADGSEFKCRVSAAGKDRKSTRLNSSHQCASRMQSSACKK